MPYIIDRGNIIPVNVDNKTKSLNYPTHDLNSVFTHWDDKLKRNVSTPNKLPNIENKLNNNGGMNNNGESK